MSARPDGHPAGRWLLPLLVVLLVLGHICDLSAFAHLDAHHHAEGSTDQQLTSCDAMPTAASAGQTRTGSIPGVAVALAVIDEAPAHRVAAVVERRAALVDRPPLFLLHAALLI
jgi:hypothetical protein